MEPLFLLDDLQALDRLLIAYLRQLKPEQWSEQTVAPKWQVKDVALHLLDGNLRALSMLRDDHWPDAGTDFGNYEDLLVYLNGLNATWVEETRRLSPRVTTDLLEFSGKQYLDLLAGLDPFAEATFSVAWAGEETSRNWFHVAREYTEKWHHQQQIRLATGDEHTLLEEQYYRPYLATTICALPYHYRDVPGVEGDVLQFVFRGDNDKSWALRYENNGWVPTGEITDRPRSKVIIPDRYAWRVFMKAMPPKEAVTHVQIVGDDAAGRHLLELIAVMA